ncbi:uncharacterized protein LACBIDRAFT_325972 [Laccaria bicolor S238N-H82]|uniref:Predicted protein n=1 Tax=Laccaria bicolor (strain S238N-H82 / ATCC MYA-4686) TaxID=486041 RepID=B0D6V2_LACBS|nr:uncharacterized protein LACBIDRAFT_325972 [Laccaria bicolor S238N-H82]EDR09288.1 predicted protein [Laccaria bicolor S238N-H82]|eukprot:XP_001879637.1 predicted protein [Laccaria bicolor S238N-H82]
MSGELRPISRLNMGQTFGHWVMSDADRLHLSRGSRRWDSEDGLHLRCALPVALQASTETRNRTMDTSDSEDHLLPRRDPFPQQLSEAAKALPHFTTAYAQFREAANSVDLHVEAPEIMKRFVGDFQFGEDPKGVLFYDSFANIGVVQYTVVYYQGAASSKTGPLRRKLVARFIARVDTKKYKLPPIRLGRGQGEWANFSAATSPADVLRQDESDRLYIQFPCIAKEVYFATNKKSRIKGSGILIFRNITELKTDTSPSDDDTILAYYSPDKIVFFLKTTGEDEGSTALKEVGLFLPDLPLKDIGQPNVAQLPETTWLEYKEPEPSDT